MNGDEGRGEPEFTYDDLTSAREAAKLLRVSESTVWRWIDQDILPAYRVGRKRVWLRRKDLESLVAPARKLVGTVKRGQQQMADREKLKLTEMAYRRPGDEVARARALQTSVLERRGGKLLGESWQDIVEARAIRSAEE